jgi:PAS domain S-box-containing protein
MKNPVGVSSSRSDLKIYNIKKEKNLREPGVSNSENQLRLNLHFEQTPLAVIEWDINFNVVKWNPSAERIFGYSEGEAKNKSAFDLIVNSSDKNYVTQLFEQLLSQEGGRRSTNKNHRKDGKTITCEWYNNPLVNTEGELIGIASLVEDISEKVKNQKIQQAIYKISESVNTIEDINELYKEIHKIIKGLMKADNFYIALYDEILEMISFPYFVDEFDSQPKKRKLGKGLTEYILRCGDNHLIDAEEDIRLRKEGETDLLGQPAEIWLGVALKIKNQPIGVIVVQDYTDKTTYGEEEKQLLTFVSEQIASAITKKRNDEELKKYSNELQELNASKDKFFSIIAHDIRSPFNGLLGLVNILKNEFDYLTVGEQKSYIDEVYSSISSIHALAENLLDWSRLQIGKQRFRVASIRLFNFLNDVISSLLQNAKLKNIEIINEVNPDEKVFADDPMLRTLFHNLISNSIKFTKPGGCITIKAEAESDDKLLVSVSDTGIGISEENIKRLFKIDENFTTPGTNKEKGTGLGLLLCNDIAEKHGSKLVVKSESGKGSSFSVSLDSKYEI